jgi:signal transduction histidine kinase
MSIVGLLCLLFALVASLLLVLYWVQRREIRSVEQLSQQVQRIAIGGRLNGRVDLQSDQPEISLLTTSINHLLTRVAATNESEAASATPKLFAELGDRIH